MNATLLHAVVRVADARTPDADLLARFVRAQDGIAFAELVRRHGPLVWAVCRQLLPHHADAEDAFQAVFLALVNGASRIRSGQALPAWLHGVAVRAAAKAKRTAARRRQREVKAAVPEADRPVPDASWGRLMAAVHEEVQRLPDAERVAFVLCELEGVRQPDAAARLGWPLGTLSGQLSKARQRLLDQLNRRGIAPAMLVVGGLAGSAGSVPAALVLKANSIPTAVGIPSTVAELARGLVGGVTMRTKLLAATVLVAGAIGIGGGALVLTHAGAQDPDVVRETKELLGGLAGADSQPPSPDGGGAKQPGATPGRPKGGGASGGLPGGPRAGSGDPSATGMPGGGMMGPGGMGMAMGMGVAHTQWEYKFVQVGDDRGAFEKAITTAGNDGWEFAGSERLTNAGPDIGTGGPPVRQPAHLVLVLKRPKGGAAMGGMMGGFGRSGEGGAFGGGGSGRGGRGGPGGLFGGGPGGEGGGRGSAGGRGGPGGIPGGEGGGRGRPGGPGEGTGAPGPGGRGPGAGGSGEGVGGPMMPGSAPGAGPGAMPGPGGFPGGPGGRPAPGGPPGMPGMPGGYGPGGFGEGGMPGMLGGSSPRVGGLTLFTLKHAPANGMATVLQQVFGNKADITVDSRTEQLIIRADDATLQELKALLEKLDVQVPPKR